MRASCLFVFMRGFNNSIVTEPFFIFSCITVRCRYPEVLVRLGPKENHTVPICSSDFSDWDVDRNSGHSVPLKQNVFKCDALVCNRCRCDVKMGYKLSNDTEEAECVMFCPRARPGGSDRRGCISARTGQSCT